MVECLLYEILQFEVSMDSMLLKICQFLLITLLITALQPSRLIAKTQDEHKIILILNSYHAGYKGSDDGKELKERILRSGVL